MNRRELIKSIAFLTGASVVGSSLYLSGCTMEPKDTGPFTRKTIRYLNEVGEAIIPATDTPGAKAAKIGEFMKTMVSNCYTDLERQAFLEGLESLELYSKESKGKGFEKCTAADKVEILQQLAIEAKEFNRQRSVENPVPVHYFTMLKQLTLWGFFTSETGMTQTLRHLPVPGRYDGNYPYKIGERAWSE
jgi:putative ubiquitin-RnfH superfamily antitoxin RatB of RatAB toxin-antitoxin module